MRINNKNVRLGVFIALMLPVSVFAESVFNGFIPLKDTMDSVEQKLKEKNLTYTVNKKKQYIQLTSQLNYAGAYSRYAATLFFDQEGKLNNYFQAFDKDDKDPEDPKSSYQGFVRYVIHELKESGKQVSIASILETARDGYSDKETKGMFTRIVEVGNIDKAGPVYRDVRIIWPSNGDIFTIDVIHWNGSKSHIMEIDNTNVKDSFSSFYINFYGNL